MEKEILEEDGELQKKLKKFVGKVVKTVGVAALAGTLLMGNVACQNPTAPQPGTGTTIPPGGNGGNVDEVDGKEKGDEDEDSDPTGEEGGKEPKPIPHCYQSTKHTYGDVKFADKDDIDTPAERYNDVKAYLNGKINAFKKEVEKDAGAQAIWNTIDIEDYGHNDDSGSSMALYIENKYTEYARMMAQLYKKVEENPDASTTFSDYDPIYLYEAMALRSYSESNTKNDKYISDYDKVYEELKADDTIAKDGVINYANVETAWNTFLGLVDADTTTLQQFTNLALANHALQGYQEKLGGYNLIAASDNASSYDAARHSISTFHNLYTSAYEENLTMNKLSKLNQTYFAYNRQQGYERV